MRIRYSLNCRGESVMAPSAAGYLFLLVIGFLSLAATVAVAVAVAVSAYRRGRGIQPADPRQRR